VLLRYLPQVLFQFLWLGFLDALGDSNEHFLELDLANKDSLHGYLGNVQLHKARISHGRSYTSLHNYWSEGLLANVLVLIVDLAFAVIMWNRLETCQR